MLSPWEKYSIVKFYVRKCENLCKHMHLTLLRFGSESILRLLINSIKTYPLRNNICLVIQKVAIVVKMLSSECASLYHFV